MCAGVVRVAFACVFSVAAAGSLYAQGTIAGIALDETTGGALPCIDVSLVRNDGEVVARTRTLGDGAFMMPAPPSGVYRIKFRMFGAYTLESPYDTLTPDADRETIHKLGFRIATSESSEWGYSSSDGDRPPRPIDREARPQYPYLASQNRRDGEVFMRYLVNADGTVREQFTQSVADSHATFERTVRKFIHSTAFEPGHRNQQPVGDLVLQRFSFKVLKP